MKIQKYGAVELKVPELRDVLLAKRLGREVVIEDWPYGRSKRCTMKFSVEEKGKFERFVRQSTFNGRENKPKKATYARKIFFIEIDGKIGRVEFAKNFPMASVYMEDGSYGAASFHDLDYAVLAEDFKG